MASAIVGAFINELIELREFRQPILPMLLANGQVPGFSYWLKGMLKGGGLGIYGDLALGGIDRHGGFASALGRPGRRVYRPCAARTATEIAADDKKSRIGRRVVQTVKEVTPGANLWFSKGLTDRLVFAQLQHLLDGHAGAFFPAQGTDAEAQGGQPLFLGAW